MFKYMRNYDRMTATAEVICEGKATFTWEDPEGMYPSVEVFRYANSRDEVEDLIEEIEERLFLDEYLFYQSFEISVVVLKPNTYYSIMLVMDLTELFVSDLEIIVDVLKDYGESKYNLKI